MIDTSGNLDFSIGSEYKMKNLSIQQCGYADRYNQVEKKEDQVLKILKAINSSGLKHSLKRINLYHAYTGTKILESLEGVRILAKEAGLETKLIKHTIWSPT